MEAATSRELLRFGPFELDPASEELRRSGLIVRLPRQPFRILLLLVQRAGEVVSREEIQAAIWGDETYVDFEHGINSAIRQIRFMLGDHAETPRYVRTLPRRGYSFIAPVERTARPGEIHITSRAAPHPGPLPAVAMERAPAPPVRMRVAQRIAAIGAAALVAVTVMAALISESRRSDDGKPSTGRTIAVLPFRRLGPPITGIDERSFPEELRATVGRLPRAYVSLIETAAVNRPQDLRARADLVIDGTIRQSEDGIRVIVSVVDAASHTQIWSETFQRPARRKEGMAVEIAHRVMCEVARRFLPEPRHAPRLETKVSPAAIMLYQRARLLHSRSQAYDWMRTKELYAAAVREEPRFAEAWSGMSDVWGIQALYGPMEERDLAAKNAVDCARRAVALQPLNPEAHSTLGLMAAQREYDLAAAEDALRRATTADPSYVDGRVNLAMILAMRGQDEESLREFALAQQLDPITLDLSSIEPQLYLHARRYEDARARFREILAVHPEMNSAIWGLMYTYIAQKNWSEALALARTLPQAQPVSVVSTTAAVTEAEFLKVYRSFDTTLENGRRGGKFNDYFLAVYYAQLGENDRAFQLLHKAMDAHLPAVSYIMVDPRIDNLRGDPRFSTLVERMKLGRRPERSPTFRESRPSP
jgi:DNA-binding winged helix-turn-helix (wHTH) protein/tetratricopeptide (TPR) repeat protein/TolB-like protein